MNNVNMDVHRVAAILNLPFNVIADAEKIYRRLRREKGWVGGSVSQSDLTAASLYVAIHTSTCKPVSFRSFCNTVEKTEGRIHPKKIAKLYRKIMFKLDKIPRVCTIHPTIYALDAARKLRFSTKTRHKIEELCKTVIEKRFHIGISPLSVAGAICYIAARLENEKTTQKEIGGTLNITENAIRGVYPTLQKKLNIDLPTATGSGSNHVPPKLFKKLLVKALKKRVELYIYDIGRILHYLYPAEMKGYYIFTDKISPILEEMEKEGVIKTRRSYDEIRHIYLKRDEKNEGLFKLRHRL